MVWKGLSEFHNKWIVKQEHATNGSFSTPWDKLRFHKLLHEMNKGLSVFYIRESFVPFGPSVVTGPYLTWNIFDKRMLNLCLRTWKLHWCVHWIQLTTITSWIFLVVTTTSSCAVVTLILYFILQLHIAMSKLICRASYDFIGNHQHEYQVVKVSPGGSLHINVPAAMAAITV